MVTLMLLPQGWGDTEMSSKQQGKKEHCPPETQGEVWRCVWIMAGILLCVTHRTDPGIIQHQL